MGAENKEQSNAISCLTATLNEVRQKLEDEIKRVADEANATKLELQKEVKELTEENNQQTEEIKRIKETYNEVRIKLEQEVKRLREEG